MRAYGRIGTSAAPTTEAPCIALEANARPSYRASGSTATRKLAVAADGWRSWPSRNSHIQPVEHVAAFVSAMQRAGMEPVEAVASALQNGRLVRFRCEGDKPGRRNGWAVLHLDRCPAGAFGHHRLGIAGRWRAGDWQPVGPIERSHQSAQPREFRAHEHATRRETQAQARETALARWQASIPAAPMHPYLVRKGMTPDGLREHNGELLVPLRDPATGELWNLQRIGPEGRKRFLAGARVKGLLWGRGAPAGTLALCEGVATAAAVHAATGLCAFAGLSAGELANAAMGLRVRWPAARLLIGADADRNGTGETAARKAAHAVDGELILPPRPRGWEAHGWDFADLWTAGEGAVIAAVFAARGGA